MKHLKLIALCAVLTLTAVLLGCSASSEANPNIEGPVYLPSKEIWIDFDGSIYMDTSYEYDEHGNVHHYERFTAGKGSSEDETDTRTYEEGFYDEYGRAKGDKDADGNYFEYKYERKNGMTTKVESPWEVKTYTYHDNGRLKSVETKSDYYHSLMEYDKEGFIVRNDLETDLQSSSLTYEWMKNLDGTPSEFTEKSGTSTETYTVECDEHGNIAKIYDENGKLDRLYEYVEIENPSEAAWVESGLKSR